MFLVALFLDCGKRFLNLFLVQVNASEKVQNLFFELTFFETLFATRYGFLVRAVVVDIATAIAIDLVLSRNAAAARPAVHEPSVGKHMFFRARSVHLSEHFLRSLELGERD